MRADMSIPVPTSSFKPQLRLNLQDMNGLSEEDEEEALGSRLGHSRGGHSVSLKCPPTPLENGSTDTTGSDQRQPSAQRFRTNSAKRPLQNGIHRSDSPPSSKTGLPHKPSPPKSAQNLRPKVNNKGRIVRPREQNGKSPERQGSPSPPRIQATVRSQPASFWKLSNRQPRRRLMSRSEDRSTCNSGDNQSPRLSISEQQQQQQQQLQHSFNGTMSSEGSEDPKNSPASPVGRGGAGGTSSTSSSSSAWDVFEEHVRTIHDSSDMFSRYQGPSFRASNTFQEAMTGLYGYPDYSHPPGPSVQSVTSRGVALAGAAKRFLDLRKKSTVFMGGGGDAKDTPLQPRPPADKETVANAKRGWRVLKAYVQEEFVSKRTSQAALGWTMLSQTLKGLSDKEKTRMDLYRRYGIVPTVNSDGRLVMVNTMLSERAQLAIANGSRHPFLAYTGASASKSKSLPSAGSANSLLSPRWSKNSSSGGGGPGPGAQHPQRRVRSSVARTSISFVEPARVSVNGNGGGGGVNGLRNGVFRHSAEFLNRSPNRSHTP